MKIIEGIVVSNKMQKTAVVKVTRKAPHKLYKKIIKKSKKYKADLGNFSVSVGDRVKIKQTRPLSKDKNFKIIEVIKQEKEEKS